MARTVTLRSDRSYTVETDRGTVTVTSRGGALVDHASTHHQGGQDEIAAEALASAGTDLEVLSPTGNGGVELNRLADLDAMTETQQDQTYYVDPNGDDDNDGSSNSPLATLQEAFDRVAEKIKHDIDIVLTSGTHTNDADDVYTRLKILEERSSLTVRGETGTAADVVLDSANLRLSVHGSTGDTVFRDFRLDGGWVQPQPADGVTLQNMEFRGPTDTGSAIQGDRGDLFVLRCDFQDVERAVRARTSVDVNITNCTGLVDGWAYEAQRSSTVRVKGTATGPDGRYGRFRPIYGSRIELSGKTLGSENPQAVDEWGDGNLTSRRISSDGVHRPQWSIDIGSPTAERSRGLVFPSDSAARVRSDDHYVQTGEWEWKWKCSSTPGTGIMIFYCAGKIGDPSLRIDLDTAGNVDVRQFHADGSATTIDSGTWPVDDAEHTVTLERDNGDGGITGTANRVRLSVDGAEQFDTTYDTYFAGDQLDHLGIYHSFDAETAVKSVVMTVPETGR